MFKALVLQCLALLVLMCSLNFQKEQAITFVNNFKSVSMIGIAIIGIFLAVQHFKNSQRTVVAAPASNVESGEIEDDEF